MKFKEIRLYPSVFPLHVYVTDNHYNLEDIFKKKYGATDEFVASLHTDLALRLETKSGSEMKGMRVFLLILADLKPDIVAHELIHLLWHFNETVGVEMNSNSQEWQALFIEYLTSEILKDDYEEER